MRKTCAALAGFRVESAPFHVMGSPLKRMSPFCGVSKRFVQRSKVDFPEPDDPMRDTTSPRLALSVTPLSKSNWPYDLCKSEIEITGSV